MTDLKTLSSEMAKLKKQIETVFYISGYWENSDLSGLSDYEERKNPNDWQKIEEYEEILYELDEIKRRMDYYNNPVEEAGRLHLNSQGRYETDKGHCYTSGSCIEFMRTKEVYNRNKSEDAHIWTTSWIESRNGEYYIVGYPDVELSGLTVRIRR